MDPKPSKDRQESQKAARTGKSGGETREGAIREMTAEGYDDRMISQVTGLAVRTVRNVQRALNTPAPPLPRTGTELNAALAAHRADLRAIYRAMRVLRRRLGHVPLAVIAMALVGGGKLQSDDAHYLADSLQEIYEWASAMPRRPCASCGKSIDDTMRADARYCSAKCRRKAHRVRRLPRTAVQAKRANRPNGQIHSTGSGAIRPCDGEAERADELL